MSMSADDVTARRASGKPTSPSSATFDPSEQAQINQSLRSTVEARIHAHMQSLARTNARAAHAHMHRLACAFPLICMLAHSHTTTLTRRLASNVRLPRMM